ncbi:unnamed protein product, partial [marine sediment metagenome]
EEKFRSMVQHMTDMIWIIDKETRFLYETPSCSGILGYDPGFLLGMDALEFIHPDDLESVQSALGEVFDKVNPFLPTAFRFRHADGRWIELEAVANNLLDHPAINGIVVTARDITERKGDEKAQAMLLNISEAANTIDSLEQFLGMIHNEMGALVDATNFYVALYDEMKDIYTFPFWLDNYEPGPRAPQAMPNSLTDFVRRSGVPLLADTEMFALLQEKGRVQPFGHPAKIWLGVPLKTSQGTKGVLVMQSYSDSNKFSNSDLDMLS